MKKGSNKNIFVLLLIFVLATIVGVVFYNKMSFSGTGVAGNISSNWKMDITNINVCSISDELKDSRCQAIYGEAENDYSNTLIDNDDSLRATFAAYLTKTSDSITYKVEVKNSGANDAKLMNVSFDGNNNLDKVMYTYNNLVVGEVIKKGDTKVFYVMVTYLGEDNNSPMLFKDTIDLSFALAN